jgi:hypothetical protein
MPKSKVSKPRPLRMARNMRFPGDPLSPAAAYCTKWSVKLEDDDETHECGKAVEVELLCFDEGDGKQLRKLAAWLLEAAKWVEAK